MEISYTKNMFSYKFVDFSKLSLYLLQLFYGNLELVGWIIPSKQIFLAISLRMV
jgi:hypothetical protein